MDQSLLQAGNTIANSELIWGGRGGRGGVSLSSTYARNLAGPGVEVAILCELEWWVAHGKGR